MDLIVLVSCVFVRSLMYCLSVFPDLFLFSLHVVSMGGYMSLDLFARGLSGFLVFLLNGFDVFFFGFSLRNYVFVCPLFFCI